MTFLVLTNGDAAGLIAIVVGAVISGAFLYSARSKPKEAPETGKNLATEPIGQTAADIWFRRFERIERGQNVMMAILIGQGFGFLLFALKIRQEGVEGLHKINDKVDLVQMAVSQNEIRRR